MGKQCQIAMELMDEKSWNEREVIAGIDCREKKLIPIGADWLLD